MLLPLKCLSVPQLPSVKLSLMIPARERVLTGTELKASIVLDVVEEPGVVLRELVAEVRGVGRTNWVDLCSDKIYDANQDYIRHVISLAPPGTTLLSGRHQYPIQVLLPKDLPSSYESACGSVRYSLRVTMNVQGEKKRLAENFPFFVVSSTSFDQVPPSLMRPICCKDDFDFTVCSLPFGRIFLKISVPRLAYQLGETITPLVHVKNSARTTLADCSIQLIMKVQYKAVSRYEHVEEKKLVEERVCESWLGRIKSQSEMTSFKCRLRAPEDIPPSTMNTAGGALADEGALIAVSYVLRLHALPDVEVEMPVIVTALGFERDAAAALKQKAARDVGLQRSQTTDV
ncbi:Arrestin domain containing protein [Aphelenchoides fujianensis]|nr:Arrestin domain containing protein [Aphelenchoides fujianensis]